VTNNQSHPAASLCWPHFFSDKPLPKKVKLSLKNALTFGESHNWARRQVIPQTFHKSALF
jgi:hypothetical protein